MQTRLRVARWALDGALATVGDDPGPSMATVADVMAAKREIALAGVGDDPTPSMELVAAVMAAKREIAIAGVEVCDTAMAVAGGSAFFRGSPIERAYRDIRAAAFHPFTPEQTLVHAGRLQLGLPADHA